MDKNPNGSNQEVSGQDEGGNGSKTLTLSSESTATDALSPDALTSPLGPDESYQLVDLGHWGERPRSGGGASNDENEVDDQENEKDNAKSNEEGIYQQQTLSANGSHQELLPTAKEENNGYPFNQTGHKKAWTASDEMIEELPMTSAIRVGNETSMEDVPYPLPTSGFLPDIALNGSSPSSLQDVPCDNNDPNNLKINDTYEVDVDDDDTQSIHSYDGEQIEAYDRRKSRENSFQKIIPETDEAKSNPDVESSRKKSKSSFLNPARMLKIPSISAIVSSNKKKKQVGDAHHIESENEQIDDKKVFPPLLSSTTPTNDETSLAIDLHHPFMSSGLDSGEHFWPDDDFIAPPYTQIEMIRFEIASFILNL